MLIREMQIKTTVGYYVTVIKIGKINITVTSSGDNVEKLEYLNMTGGIAKWLGHFGKQLAGHQNVEHRTAYDPAIPHVRCVPQRIENVCVHKNLCINLH